MEKIERYVYTVGTYLPKPGKEDILKELRSTIWDMVEDQVGQETPTEGQIDAILLELGEPRQLAMKYRGHTQYLIGPMWFDAYWLVLKISFIAVITVIGVTSVIGMISEISESYNYTRALLQLMADVVDAGIGVFGTVTLIFFLLERYGPSGKAHALEQFSGKPAWHPSKLEPVPKPHQQLKRSDVVASLVFTLLALIVMNLYADKIGIYYQADDAGGMTFLQVLSLERLSDYLIYWNIIWLLYIALGLYVLQAAKHTLYTVVTELLLSVASIVLLVWMFQDSSLIDQAAIHEALYSAGAADSRLETVLTMSWRITVVVCIAIFGVDLFQRIRAVFRFVK